MAMSLRIDPYCNLNSNVNDLMINPTALVTGINDNVGKRSLKGASPPGIKLCIQVSRKAADRGVGKLLPHQCLGNLLHLPR